MVPLRHGLEKKVGAFSIHKDITPQQTVKMPTELEEVSLPSQATRERELNPFAARRVSPPWKHPNPPNRYASLLRQQYKNTLLTNTISRRESCRLLNSATVALQIPEPRTMQGHETAGPRLPSHRKERPHNPRKHLLR